MSLDTEFEGLVSSVDSEALLTAVEARTADPNAGIFGPDSVSWRINRESALFLGAGRAALLQLAHPWVAAALAQHSTLLSDPIKRFHGTFRVVFTMVFGSLDQALAAARALHALHTRIRGELPEQVAGWSRGSQYEANEIAALRWVYSTLVESAVLAYEWAVAPLPESEREQYYAESRTMAALFGIPTEALPEDWESFTAYNQQMHTSDVLGVSGTAQTMAQSLLGGAGSWIKPPFWYRALTTEWLPARFRAEFGLEFGFKEQEAAERAQRRFRALHKRLPAVVRFTGPWREAEARLRGRRADAFTKLSNRFWIGQPLLPLAAAKTRR